MVAQENEAVLVDDGRAAVTPVDLEGAVRRTQMFFPDQLSGEIDGRDLPRREPCVYALAVADRARRREVVLLVNRRKRPFRGELELPDLTSAPPIEREN